MRQQRPPIVTVLGHVDHGKTTLLDALRKTSVASREAGGITQGIGATKLITPEGAITFIDTPGHAAFSKMRARGARVADIAILVVAADDGLMPQTKEAISYIKQNSLPLIVAFTKVDLPSANVEKARGQLEAEAIFFEGRGGATPLLEISAKEGKGVDALIETILLLAGVTGFTGDAEAPLLATVIETNKDKRGTLVSAVIKDGKLKVGDEIAAATINARVKGLFDQNNRPVKEAYPGDPVLILGFSAIPGVGAEITSEKAVKPEQSFSIRRVKIQKGQLPLIIKVQSAGVTEAIISTLPVGVAVLDSSVGEVTESDVFLAKTSGAIIVAFESGVPNSVKRLAETEGVGIARFSIIYEIGQFLEAKINEGKKTILGKAEILAEFPFNKTKVAGCKVAEGRVHENDKVVLIRGEKELGAAKIVSMRRGRNMLKEALAGEECGIILSPLLPFEKGDILVATK